MYNSLSQDIEKLILSDRKKGAKNPYAFKDEDAVRENPSHDASTIFRSPFIRDVDKIMNLPYFARYQDKTQVFSLYKNDDITRRSLHVQFVSRIARTIGKALNLNLELIEAIALGHDIGHTPFAHEGEYALDKIYHEKTGRHFLHNVQSARVLTEIFPCNISLQTLDGILCHNGEIEQNVYRPEKIESFDELYQKITRAKEDLNYAKTLTPATLEGCVVKLCDIISYLGKDRQDAEKIKKGEFPFSEKEVNFNAEMINNFSIDVIENSYRKPYIKMSDQVFSKLCEEKKKNYREIYLSKNDANENALPLENMMKLLYEKFLSDLKAENKNSYIYRHHVNYINKITPKRKTPYSSGDINDVVTDYIASMTDDYFIELFNKLFPESKIKIKYKGYFD